MPFIASTSQTWPIINNFLEENNITLWRSPHGVKGETLSMTILSCVNLGILSKEEMDVEFEK